MRWMTWRAVSARPSARAWSGVAAAAEDALRHAAVVAAYGGAAREAKRCGAALDAHVAAVGRVLMLLAKSSTTFKSIFFFY